MTAISHAFKSGLFGKARTYTLTDDAMVWTEEGKPDGRLAYADIVRVQLYILPNMNVDHRYCTVMGRDGQKQSIRQIHLAGIGKAEDRTATFAPFVRALCGRAAAANPQAKFIAGSTGWWTGMIVLLVIIALGALVAVMVMFNGGGFNTQAVLPLVLVMVLGPGAWRAVRRGGAKPFDPQDPPVELTGNPDGTVASASTAEDARL